MIGATHPVRLLDEILAACDWSEWEAQYNGRRGQPPIHPRVLAWVLLYCLTRGLRSSRQLEYVCTHNIDFLWLVEVTLDGTRVKANNGRNETLTAAKLEERLKALDEQLFSPSKSTRPQEGNPARREDPTQPVPPEQWDKRFAARHLLLGIAQPRDNFGVGPFLRKWPFRRDGANSEQGLLVIQIEFNGAARPQFGRQLG